MATKKDTSDASRFCASSLNLREPNNLSLEVGERVVWIMDKRCEHGVVRWIGGPKELDVNIDEPIAGVEFDNPVGSGIGRYKGDIKFKVKMNHAHFIPMVGLIKEKDLDTSNDIDSNMQINSSQKKSLRDCSTVLLPFDLDSKSVEKIS